MANEIRFGKEFKVVTGFLVPRSVDIKCKYFDYNSLLDIEGKVGGYGLQLAEPLHSDVEKTEKIKNLLFSISEQMIQLNDLLDEKEKA